MTILYKVKGDSGTAANKAIICKVSSKNIVAFCDLQDAISNVYVYDIVTPWQTFKVNSSKEPVSVLEWNSNGELLLMGYNGGNVEIWSTEKVLNEWNIKYRANFPCEDVLAAKFFHSGKSVYFHSQKKDLPAYADKFERLEQRPTMEHFGSSPTEGAIVVTASGLLGVFVLPNCSEGTLGNRQIPDLTVATHSLGLSRCFITYCSLSHAASGSLNIAVSYSSRSQLIYCFKVNVQVAEQEDNLLLKCESLPSVFLAAGEQKKVSYIKWTTVGKDDVIYLAYNCMEGSLLEQWNLTRKPQSVHKLLQKTKNDFVYNECWDNTAKQHFMVGISEVCISKLLSDITNIYVVLKDNTVQVLEQGLKAVGAAILDCPIEERLLGCKFIAADVTFMNQILVVFDNLGQMYAAQVSHANIDKNNFKANTLALQTSLLEYSIITGTDASDILMLNMGSLDMLIEKLTDNFSRQPNITRQFYYSNFLSLKSNMCRIQSKQQDFDNLIILHSISITFKSLLRPADLSSQDKGPAENLASILMEPIADVDKVLCNLDAKDFTVEPLTLQSLQQLVQWVADLALNILHRLPEEAAKAKLNKKQGYDISRDMVAIGSIRELLVMIRIWGLLNSQCLPIYTKSVENVDVLSILFRLLTRLAQNSAEPDEMLLDECNMLSTQVLIPPREFNHPTTLLNSHVSLYKSFPFNFTAAVEPVAFQDIPMKEVVFASGTKDGVSNLQLGSRVKPIRKCIRCGFVNSLQKVAKTSALKAWCYRWQYCHCGGYWKKM